MPINGKYYDWNRLVDGIYANAKSDLDKHLERQHLQSEFFNIITKIVYNFLDQWKKNLN